MTIADPAWALPLGAALDAIVGAPRAWPHPVRGIGRLIAGVERLLRTTVAGPSSGRFSLYLAGVALVVVVAGLTAASVWGLVVACDQVGGVAPLLGRTLLVYWGLAARSLRDETLRASEAPNLAMARRELSMIVGRDTADLGETEIRRACIETVAENTNDGIVAPLLWYAAGGPVGMWVYKAVSTLDSMVGYKDDRYRYFGWASARLDDLLNLMPARLTWLLVAVAALALRERPIAALRIGWRDGRKHPSPNAGWGEAAMAGALGVQLGGVSIYRGVPSAKPLLGEPLEPIERKTVWRAIRLMIVVSVLALIVCWIVRIRGVA